MKPISIIVAIAKNHAIGKDNKLLWHISADLKRFKRITAGHTVIMGKNTFHSLPNGPLVNRRNIVISDNPADRFPGCEMAFSLDDAMHKCDSEHENFVIGGASIYRQFLPLAGKLYVTRVMKAFEADTFFPEISGSEWIVADKEDVNDDPQNDFTYSFITYQRKNYL